VGMVFRSGDKQLFCKEDPGAVIINSGCICSI